MSNANPVRHLGAAEEAYGPDIWARYADEVRAARESRQWPCFVHAPVEVALGFMDRTDTPRVALARYFDAITLGSLAAWRESRHVYRPSADQLDRAFHTPVDMTQASERLLSLPEHATYVEVQRQLGRIYVEGVLAQLSTGGDGSLWCWLLLDLGAYLVPAGQRIGGSFAEANRLGIDKARETALRFDLPEIGWFLVERSATTPTTHLGPLLNLLLQLCAEDMSRISVRPSPLAPLAV